MLVVASEARKFGDLSAVLESKDEECVHLVHSAATSMTDFAVVDDHIELEKIPIKNSTKTPNFNLLLLFWRKVWWNSQPPSCSRGYEQSDQCRMNRFSKESSSPSFTSEIIFDTFTSLLHHALCLLKMARNSNSNWACNWQRAQIHDAEICILMTSLMLAECWSTSSKRKVLLTFSSAFHVHKIGDLLTLQRAQIDS